MSHRNGAESAPTPRWVWALAALASVGVVIAAFAAPYLPTHDGPQHLYLAHVGKHYSNPGSLYAEVYRPTTALTALGFSLVYGPALEVLPWRRALQVTLAIMALGWSWGFLALVRSVNRERTILGLVGFATAFQWAVYMGFFSYVLSLSLTFCCAALAIRSDLWHWRYRLGIAALISVQGVVHVFGAQVSALFLVVLVLVRHRPRQWPRELALLALMGIPVALLTARAAGYIGESAPLRPQPEDTPMGILDRLQLLRGLFVGGPGWRGWIPLMTAAGALALFFARHSRRPASRNELALALTACMLLAAGAFGPIHLDVWEYFSPRFLVPGVMLALPLLPLEAAALRWPRLPSAAVALFSGAAIAWAAWFNRESHRQCADLVSGLDAPIQGRGFRLPLALQSVCEGNPQSPHDQAFPFVRPAANFGALYAAAQGGLVPYAFAMIPQLHTVVVRESAKARLPPVPPRALFWQVYENPDTRLDAEKRRSITTQLAEDGSLYEDVLIHGANEDRDTFLALGYRLMHGAGKLAILRFEGCPVEITLAAAGRPRQPTLIEHAWDPGDRIHTHPPLPPASFDDSGRARVSAKLVPCGKARLRAFVDMDDSQTFSAGDIGCSSAGPDGWLSLQAAPEGTAAPCDLRARVQ